MGMLPYRGGSRCVRTWQTSVARLAILAEGNYRFSLRSECGKAEPWSAVPKSECGFNGTFDDKGMW